MPPPPQTNPQQQQTNKKHTLKTLQYTQGSGQFYKAAQWSAMDITGLITADVYQFSIPIITW